MNRPSRQSGGTGKLARARFVRQRGVDSGEGSSRHRRLSGLPDEDQREPSMASSMAANDTADAADAAVEAACVDVSIILMEAPQRVTLSARLVTLVCCSQKTVWVFRSRGLAQFGQSELLLVLERARGEASVPDDVIRLFAGVLGRAKAGDIVGDLDHTVFHASVNFLGSSHIGGVLYFMDSGQCFHGLASQADQGSLLLCRLAHSREVPALMQAPLRLLLRMGEEDGVYPCSIISRRFRPALFHESCRSVYYMFRDVLPHRQGMIPRLRECQISLECSSVTVSIPHKRHPDLLALLRIYAPDTDGILALGGELCQFADAHLVAMETPACAGCETVVFKTTGGKPTVTGASFVAVAAHSPGGRGVGVPGNAAAVVEDGVAVTCGRDDMRGLLQSLKCAADFTITADCLFPAQRRKVHRKCPIKFVWRLNPGQ